MSAEPGPLHEKETGRLEAFSDGVFAIAVTLLVLELKVPQDTTPGKLWGSLVALWPSYLAFLTSFVTIGIIWINHHQMFTFLRRSDQYLLLLNLLFLLGVTFLPFPTQLIAEYLQRPDAPAAALVYTGTLLVIALLFNVLWGHIHRRPLLMRPDADEAAIVAVTRAFRMGPPFNLLALLVALVNPTLSLLLILAAAVFFALPRHPLRS